jgi:PAS domain S-box-containing protein
MDRSSQQVRRSQGTPADPEGVRSDLNPESASGSDTSQQTSGGGDPALALAAVDGLEPRDIEAQLARLGRELTETRATLQATAQLLREVPAYISVHEGPDHRIVVASALLERMLGDRCLQNVPFAEGFPPDLRGDLQARLDGVFRSGYPSIQRETFWSVRDEASGVLRELCSDEVIQPWFAEDGSVRGVMRFAVDVMAQVRARRELHESERRLRTVVERAPVGIALLGPDFTWRRVNDQLCRLLEQSPANVLGRPFQAMFPLEDWCRIEPALAALQSGETEHVHLEARLRRGHGKPLWCSLSLSVLGNTRLDQIVAILDDVSERKEYRERLEQEARRREEFMAMLGHELRNPLAALAHATDLLLRSSGDVQVARLGRVLDRQTRQMRRMVDDLLDVARIAEGKIQLQLRDIELGELVRGVAEDQLESLAARGLTLRLELPAEECWTQGDRVRLVQVLQNLLDNAAKFTDPPGELVIALAVTGSGELELCVSDTGCGMDEEMLASAFEPFRQADRTLERSRGGLGLGLPLVRGLVAMHGGRVEALSAGVGQGTRLRVTLPNAGRRERLSGLEPRASGGQGLRRLLLVEDHEDSAETLSELLRTLHYEVDVAHDAASAMERIERSRPELVLCDIGLPGAMSGYDLARQIRARWGQEIYLVALTGYGSQSDAARALAAGFDVHLRKPLELDTFEALTMGRLWPASDNAASR